MMKITVVCIPTLDEGGLIIRGFDALWKKSLHHVSLNYENGEIKDVNATEILGKHSGGSKTPAEIVLSSGEMC